MAYLVKIRRPNNSLVSAYVQADTAEAAVEMAERNVHGVARSVWPVDWDL